MALKQHSGLAKIPKALDDEDRREIMKSSLLLNSHHQHIKTLLNPHTPDNINKVKRMMGEITSHDDSSGGGIRNSRQLKHEGYSPQNHKKANAKQGTSEFF
jgi:hypothetical protein